MARAHRQAWAWQDEWHGLTMENIREIERQTQLALQQKMALTESGEEITGDDDQDANTGNTGMTPQETNVARTFAATLSSIEKNEDLQSPPRVRKPSDIPIINTAVSSEGEVSPEDSPTEQPNTNNSPNDEKSEKKSWKKNAASHSPSSAKSMDMQIANWRMESIVRESETSSEEEFFDCQGKNYILLLLSFSNYSNKLIIGK